jgi:hypothetical protein
MNVAATTQLRQSALVLVVAGAASTIVASRGSELLANNLMASVALAMAIFFLGAFLSASKFEGWRLVSVAMFLGGIALSVLIDAIVDSAVYSRDRNLFPLEIAWWWLIGIVPVTVGVIARHLLHRSRQ